MHSDDGTDDVPESDEGRVELQAQTEPVLPDVVPPQTKAPIQFNQQVNLSIQQIPQLAWDRLSPDQIVEISRMIVTQVDSTDKRHFDYAMDEVKRSASGKKIAMSCGAFVAIAGFGATAYLAMNNHELIALAIALPLSTIIAMIVGNRFLG
jgi:hypothetical protein